LKNNRGFTLIELIVTLVIFSFIGTALIIFIVNTTQAYILSKKRTETAMNVQMALFRITIELQNASPISIYSGTGGIFFSKSMEDRAIRNKNNTIELLTKTSSPEEAYELLPESSMKVDYIDTGDNSSNSWTAGTPDLKLIQITITVPGIELDGTTLTVSTKVIPRG